MKILFTCNGLLKGNGVRSAVLSLKSRLQDEGLEVKILSSINDDNSDVQSDFPLGHFVFPIFEPIIATNGFRYAKIDKHTIRKAVEWADVVHIMEAFPLESAVVKIAKDLGKPCVGTFHLFTENITANLGMGEVALVNNLINLWWRKATYNYCKSIQCPTRKVMDYLIRHGYSSDLRVISNGIDIPDSSDGDNIPQNKPWRIITVGRLANEKSQMTLIKAMRHSKHAADIELYFAGKGPKEKEIKRAAYRLFEDGIVQYEPIFGYYDADRLKEILDTSYLYIHCATIEVEGLSCLEAIKEGVVPVIADAKLSATGQFALDDRSLFPAADPKALAERIDWWIEHPEERRMMSLEYKESTRKYDILDTTLRIIGMYEEVMGNEKN